MISEEKQATLDEARRNVERLKDIQPRAVEITPDVSAVRWGRPAAEPPKGTGTNVPVPREADTDWGARIAAERALVMEAVGTALGESAAEQLGEISKLVGAEIALLRNEMKAASAEARASLAERMVDTSAKYSAPCARPSRSTSRQRTAGQS
jgi:hypothetical protein